MTAIDKQPVGMGLLKESGPDLGGGDVGRQRQHWRQAALRIVKPVDEVNAPGPAAPGTDGQATCQLGFGRGGERAGFLVSDGNPIHIGMATHGFGDSVE